MKTSATIMLVIGLACHGSAFGEYRETLDSQSPKVDATEFGLVDDGGRADQSARLQKAVDSLGRGGRLFIPKGVYSFSSVALRSNVHVLIEAGAVLKPVRNPKTGDGRWLFEMGRDAPVQNVSIRGLGGRFEVNLEDYNRADRVRAIVCSDVDNFLIADVNVRDNYTTFSSIILTSPDSEKTGFAGPRNGTIRDCSTFNASVGYGLVQAHAAKNILFENLYALGGVAMRLECGVRPKNPAQQGGVFDVRGKNIRCENGYVALLMSPHSTPCGVVEVDGVEAISCEFAIKFTNGFISKKKQREGDAPGYFAEGTTVRNIRAVYGTEAQRSPLHLKYTRPELRHLVRKSAPGALRGPAIAAVLDQANYEVNLENVSAEGFVGMKPVIGREDAFKDAGLRPWAEELIRYVKDAKAKKR